MTTTDEDAPRRKGRQKTTTDLGRTILRRERERLVKEQAMVAEQLAQEAQRSRAMGIRQNRQAAKEQTNNAFQRSVVRRVGAVLSSEGVNVPLQVQETNASAVLNAWTDFSTIHVGYHMLDDIRLTAAVVRGLFYHEGGHCRFTVPFPNLERMVVEATGQSQNTVDIRGAWPTRDLHYAWNALEDQRMETAVVSDSPRKAGYFLPMVLSELADTVDHAASNWPLMVWRRYIPERIVKQARRHFVLRNGEAVAKAIEATVTKYVLATDAVTMYTAVHEMAGWLQAIEPLSIDLSKVGHQRQVTTIRTDLDDDALTIPVSPDMLTDDDTMDPNERPTGYDLADPAVAEHMIDVLQRLFWFPESLVIVRYVVDTPVESDTDEQDAGQGGISTPAPSTDDGSQGGSDQDEEDEWDDDDDEQDDGAASNSQGESSTGNNEPKASQDGGQSNQRTQEQGDSASDSGAHDENADVSDVLTDEDLQQAIQDAEEARDQDRALDQDVDAFNDALDNTASTLSVYTSGANTDPEAIHNAENLADDLVAAFDAATAQNAPMWQEQKRRGILNVQRYMTRQPGDMDFFREYVDEGAPGHDVAVSLLLDYSGSMGSSTEALAQVAYACKTACTTLDIPCTVVLWDTSAMVLWDARETADRLPVIDSRGGTDPTIALNDMLSHQGDKAKHIVLIMTDGEWGRNSNMIGSYLNEGRTIIGLGYNSGYGSNIAEGLLAKGATFAYDISDLSMIATYLEEALIAAV